MERNFDREQNLLDSDLEENHIWVTSGGRITKSDNNYAETFSMPHDQPVMTVDEFDKGIFLDEFHSKLEKAKEARK